jgi:HK97 family phage major capsid protein
MSLKADLQEKRNRAAFQSKEILDRAASDGRNLTVEEEQRFDALHAELDKHDADIRRIDQQDAADKRAEESEGRKTSASGPERRESRGDGYAGNAARRLEAGRKDQDLAFRAWFLNAVGAATDEGRAAAQRVGIDLNAQKMHIRFNTQPPADLRQAKAWENGTELRAQTITTTGGGYTVPDSPMGAIETALLQFGGMRQVSSVLRTDSGSPLPIPTSNDTSNKGAILAINTQISGQDLVFGQLVLDAYKYTSKLILVPMELLQDTAININQYVGARLGERIGRILNDHFTTGTGSGEPNGVVAASTLGKTGITGQTATIIYDDLVDLEHSVDPAYRGNARWMMPDALLKVIKKLVDGNERPLWQPGLAGLAAGTPDTILGYPYTINQSMATPQASAKTLLFGDFSKYLIRDVMDIELMRLVERYADYHQVGFVAVSRHDGDLLDAGTHPIKHYIHPAA